MTLVLGLNLAHDGAAAVVKDGRLVSAITTERLTRRKKDVGVTREAVEYVLDLAGASMTDITHVAIGGYLYRPDSFITTYTSAGAPITNNPTEPPVGSGHLECIVKLGELSRPGYWVHHHTAHCASAYFTSPFDKAVMLSVDASDRFPHSCSVVTYGEGAKIYYHSCPGIMIGSAYNIFTSALGLGPGLTKAGTTMALAAFGKPLEQAKTKLKYYGQSYFARQFDPHDLYFIGRMWSELTGLPPHRGLAPRESDSELARNVAASIQYIFEETMVANAIELFESTAHYNGGNLCLSGGSFLNSDTNMAILKRAPFKNLHLFPGCGDDGTAIGGALYLAHSVMNLPRRRYTAGEICYLGKEPEPMLQGLPYDPHAVAAMIANGKTVAWCNGRSEFGPRALGARSLLADPRSPTMKDYINKELKHREWFRPFAPSVLAEKCAEWFDSGSPSPFMLLIANCLRPKEVPAIVHVDNTARMQTVTREDNPQYYELIKTFEGLTGVPMVLNTSLNGNDEPLVDSTSDALKFFARTKADVLVVGNRMISKGA